MARFVIGDVVQLRSGGPEMTVERVRVDKVYCIWFSDNKEEHGVFRPEILMKIE